MKNERMFYKCAICGNIIEVIEDGGGSLVCCGQDMGILTPNTTDASVEKHVPALTRDGNNLTVRIGSAPHPMTAEHHINWVAVAQEGRTQRAQLKVGGEPEVSFVISDGPVSVYAYCNLHGLWANEA